MKTWRRFLAVFLTIAMLLPMAALGEDNEVIPETLFLFDSQEENPSEMIESESSDSEISMDTDKEEVVSDMVEEEVGEHTFELYSEELSNHESKIVQETEELALENNATLNTDNFCPIDEVHFPDYYFRRYVLNTFDTDNDGQLSGAEISTVTVISIPWDYKSVSTIKGVEYFSALKELVVHKSNS